MVDIITGDYLVISGTEYPIKKVNPWTLTGAKSPSFDALASVACTTKRSPVADGDGFVGDPEEELTGLVCIPLSPVGAELAQALGLENVANIFETVVADGDGFVQVFIEDPFRT